MALAHDWLCGFRGGEAVLDRLAQVVQAKYSPAGLYVMFDDGQRLTPAIDSVRHVSSWLNRLPMGPTVARRWLLPMYPSATRDLSRRLRADHGRAAVDLVVSTSSAAIKGIEPPPSVPHLCYCHAPARYLWGRGEAYGTGGLTGKLRRAGLSMFGGPLRRWDRKTSATVTTFVANSRYTAAEIQRCYGRESVVIHPPVRTTYYTLDERARRDSFWLVAGALEPYKRVDLAIRAANESKSRLVIVGDGSHRSSLMRLAGPTVEFRGRVTDDELRMLYRTAGVLVFPQVEDFGIVAVEAQACGLPVVAKRAGGALDTVIEGVTGAFFEQDSVDALIGAIKRAPRDCTQACVANAAKFSEAEFDARMTEQIERVLASGRGSA